MKNLVLMMSIILIFGCSAKTDIFNSKYSGTLELTEHVLGAKVAGRLTTLTVKEGDMVKANQQVATLDRYDQAQKDYKRTEENLKSGGSNTQTLEYAQLTMEDQQIASPLDGVVLVKSAEIGETLTAGAGVVVIGDLKDQWIKVFLPEGLINQIKLGQKASIVVDGLDKNYEGHINFIATQGEFTPRNLQSKEDRMTQVFAVKVALDHPDEYVHPGVSAEVTFKK